jgi:transcriptional regulator GlxA family with amidase domain
MVARFIERADAAAYGNAAISVAFILCPHFTLMPFAAIIDTLRLAADDGDGSRQIHCRWTIVGPSLKSVEASCGIKVQPWETFGDPGRFDYVVVVGGLLHRGPTSDEVTFDYLREADRKGVTLVGVCTGSFTLIRAGLMNRRRCCVSWFHYHDLIEEFPDVMPVADRLFVVDGRRITCAGGAGALDLAAWIVERHLGRAFAQKSLHIMVVDRARSPNTPQPQPPTVPLAQSERVRRAMLLIEQHLSEPLDVGEIARRVNISRRQLERLFHREVGISLQGFSRAMRLQYGLWLLANGPRTIAEIADECGFADPSHFNRLFRATFGKPPSQARSEGREAMLALLTKARGGLALGRTGTDDLVEAFNSPALLPREMRPYL